MEKTHFRVHNASAGAKQLSVVSDSLRPHGVAHQAPLSKGFSRQEYWNGLPFPSPGDLPETGIELVSLMSSALAGGFCTTNATWEALQSPQRS